VSPTFGFGLLNATALVQRARVWSSTVGAQVKITTAMTMDNNNEADNNDNDEEEEEEKEGGTRQQQSGDASNNFDFFL
jgi:hypothetical protein